MLIFENDDTARLGLGAFPVMFTPAKGGWHMGEDSQILVWRLSAGDFPEADFWPASLKVCSEA